MSNIKIKYVHQEYIKILWLTTIILNIWYNSNTFTYFDFKSFFKQTFWSCRCFSFTSFVADPFYAPFPQSKSNRDSDVAKKWILYPFLAMSLSLSLSLSDPIDTHTFQLHPLERLRYIDISIAITIAQWKQAIRSCYPKMNTAYADFNIVHLLVLCANLLKLCREYHDATHSTF